LNLKSQFCLNSKRSAQPPVQNINTVMIRKFPFFWIILLALLVVSCSNQTQGKLPITYIDSGKSIPKKMGQKLPVSAIASFPRGQKVQLEVAITPKQKSMGLMYRQALPHDRGMLFPFSPPQPVSFWMKNVPVPLDIVFIYKGRIKAIAASVPPCKKERCPSSSSNTPISDVIEIRAGRAAELRLEPGNKVTIDYL